jgi:ABC-2 type transport system permease protein
MGWLLLKDLRILRRSPLLVGLLVLYPVVIATLIGFALLRGPEKPQVAFVNLVPDSALQIELGGEEIDVTRQAGPLFRAIDPVRVDSREEAIAKVEAGEVLGALVIPKDTTRKLQTGLEPAEIEVFYNADDPVKASYVRDTIKAQVQDANSALTKQLAKAAVEYLDLIGTGGQFEIFGRELDVLGLERAEQMLRRAAKDLPPRSDARAREPRPLGRGAVLGGLPDRRQADRARWRRHAAQLVRRGDRGHGLADVHHLAAGRRRAGAGT